MGLMEQWFAMISAGKSYGGLPVLIDNAYYPTGNGAYDSYVQDDDFFITGWFDTGSTNNKGYTLSLTLTPQGVQMYARWFNTKDATSADYYFCGANSTGQTRNVNSAPGRFIAVSVRKSEAADMWMAYKDTSPRQYIYKGTNVSD